VAHERDLSDVSCLKIVVYSETQNIVESCRPGTKVSDDSTFFDTEATSLDVRGARIENGNWRRRQRRSSSENCVDDAIENHSEVSAGFIRSLGFGSRQRQLTADAPPRSTLGSERNREYMSAGFIRSFGDGSGGCRLADAELRRSTLGTEHNRGNMSAGFIRSFGDGSRRRRPAAASHRRSSLGTEHNRENVSAGFIRKTSRGRSARRLRFIRARGYPSFCAEPGWLRLARLPAFVP
jgi:hypothetical protein